ncbi:uncharacterized protein LOC123511955 [Portunus trituberculatus]|uniref:uncharacterized protein LOC123511955 n=1 Tax=Portunus trituberculatus TaxID=210409 RepID=UPI001E1CB404|nr:uncharacterized protein LOC123511955 [Portunus trituberculatus]
MTSHAAVWRTTCPRRAFPPHHQDQYTMVAVALLTWLLFLSTQSLRSAALLRQSLESTAPEALAAVQGVLASQRQHQCPALLLYDNPSQVALTFVKDTEKLSPRGIAIFLVASQHTQGNGTLAFLKATVDKVRQMGGAWHCLVVVVVSDDPAFLTAFAHLSLRRHAFRWSTRILIFTHLPLSHLSGLHNLLSNRNAMLLLAHRSQKTTRYIKHKVDENLYYVVSNYEQIHYSTNADCGGGINASPHNHLAMHNRYRYVVSPDRTFGTKMSDGSWTGMMGLVVREEVDFGGVPFMLSPARAAAGDYTTVIYTGNVMILGGLGGLEIDPWGFLLPLTPVVWAASLMALLSVLALLKMFSLSLPTKMLNHGTLSPVRVLLQQGESQGLCWALLPGMPCVLKVSMFSGIKSHTLMKTNFA